MENTSASQQIDEIIRMHEGWKGEILSTLRTVILRADAGITEEIKWKMATRPDGLPVWTRGGIVCFAETWKDNIKLIFSNGAQMTDPSKLFNARLKSTAVRAIEFREGDTVNQTALKALILEALDIIASKASIRERTA